jgi:cell shape-determining protein MreC
MTNLSYVTDGLGNQIAVLIPINDWLAFQKQYEETKRKFEILQGIQSALQEVHQARKENRKLQSLTDFLNEC